MSPFLRFIPSCRPPRLGRLTLATLLLGGLVLVATACATDSSERAYSSTYHPSPSSQAVSTYRSSYQPARRLNQFGDSGRIDRLDRIERVDRMPAGLDIRTPSAVVVDDRGNRIYARNTRRVRPIASVTKLMTAMVVLDARVSMKTPISIIEQDRDTLKNSRSRLRIGKAMLPRDQMMMVALMSSDNRAAHALSRTTFRGGTQAFVRAMNRKAKALGMKSTTFVDATGLNPLNRSTAEDLVKMVRAASRYAFIRKTTSRGEMIVYPFANGTPLTYRNTNRLVRSGDWSIDVSKTGFINEAGRCLVMQANIAGRRLTIVLLGASGKLTPMADSTRLRDWMLAGNYTASR